jgi:hypothetical protein
LLRFCTAGLGAAMALLPPLQVQVAGVSGRAATDELLRLHLQVGVQILDSTVPSAEAVLLACKYTWWLSDLGFCSPKFEKRADLCTPVKS